jgi:hypothetical protein
VLDRAELPILLMSILVRKKDGFLFFRRARDTTSNIDPSLSKGCRGLVKFPASSSSIKSSRDRVLVFPRTFTSLLDGVYQVFFYQLCHLLYSRNLKFYKPVIRLGNALYTSKYVDYPVIERIPPKRVWKYDTTTVESCKEFTETRVGNSHDQLLQNL